MGLKFYTKGFSRGLDFDNPTVHFDLSGDNLPTELGQTDAERGYSFNSTHVYVASNRMVWYWDYDQNSTAASLDNGTGIISGGTFQISDVVATENGILGQTLSIAEGNFDLQWTDNSSTAEVNCRLIKLPGLVTI